MANTKTTTASENLYMQLNASELTAIIMKDSPNSNDRDAGFCSGSSEGGDDLSIDHHSRLDPSSPPTDASEDSVEVKVCPIALIRNKRKSSEPSKVICEREENVAKAPLKKRIRYTSATDSAVVLTPPAIAATSPPPPAAPAPTQIWHDPSQVLPHELMPNPAQVFVRHPGVTTLHRIPVAATDIAEQQEPLALVLKKPSNDVVNPPSSTSTAAASPTKAFMHKKLQRAQAEQHNANLKATSPAHTTDSVATVSNSLLIADITSESPTSSTAQSSATSSGSGGGGVGGGCGVRAQQRNYKNMTRERRIEANARERTRVHTISAAYETLRHAVPSYSHAQKLSKLSVLRVACSYILTLSRMAGYDYSEDQSEPSIANCFDAVTATIQTEGKVRKKKDE